MDDKERTLFCGNIHPKVTEELLWELFLQAGPLERVRIVTDREGNRKSFAFVTYKHDFSVPYAIKVLEGSELYGRMIDIRFRNEDARNQVERNAPQNMLPPPTVQFMGGLPGIFPPFFQAPPMSMHMPPMFHLPPGFHGFPMPPQMAWQSPLNGPNPAMGNNPDLYRNGERGNRKNTDVDYRFHCRSVSRERSRSRSPHSQHSSTLRRSHSDSFRDHMRERYRDHARHNDHDPSRDRSSGSPPYRRNYHEHDDRYRDSYNRERHRSHRR